MARFDSVLEWLPSVCEWTDKNESALIEPFVYITSNPGKEMRTHLIEAFNLWLKVPPEDLKVISRIVNMLHAASLMVDDIQDDSQLRRGSPVAHKIYGTPQTINTANYVYFLAFQELSALRKTSGKDVVSLVTQELLSLHRGQGLELLWRETLHCPTEEEYVGMVANKTGGLLRLGVSLMMACATANTDVDYIPLVNLIGILFQIRDDYMNLQSDDYTTNKGLAEDLTEGKFSFPVIHGIRADTSNRQVLNVLQKRPSTPTLKLHTISYLKNKTKSFDYTLDVLDEMQRQTRAEIQKRGGNAKLEELMDKFVVARP